MAILPKASRLQRWKGQGLFAKARLSSFTTIVAVRGIGSDIDLVAARITHSTASSVAAYLGNSASLSPKLFRIREMMAGKRVIDAELSHWPGR